MKLHHICIQTNCYEDSKEFYIEYLGFHLINETKDFHEREYNTWFELGDIKIELQTNKKNQTLVKPSKDETGVSHICFIVKNIDETLQKLENNNKIIFVRKDNKIIYEVLGTSLFKVYAPEGTLIEFRDKEID
jgi:glyoxylase I family protein